MVKQGKTATETTIARAKDAARKKLSRYEKGFKRKFADSLWARVFNNPERKEWAFTLFKSLCKTKSNDPNDLTFLTTDDAVFVGLKNDVSFIVGSTMCLYEHQTTVNPNMPIRLLPYAGMNAAKAIELFKIRVFARTEQWFPTIKCVCFFNGPEELSDETVLKLSDICRKNEDPDTDVEVKVHVLNIRYGHNLKLMGACKALRDYAWFIERARDLAVKFNNAKKGANVAIDEMPDDNILKQFLLAHRAEVTMVFSEDYKAEQYWDDVIDQVLEDGIEIGEERGVQKGKVEILADLVESGDLSPSAAAKKLGVTVSTFKKMVKELARTVG